MIHFPTLSEYRCKIYFLHDERGYLNKPFRIPVYNKNILDIQHCFAQFRIKVIDVVMF